MLLSKRMQKRLQSSVAMTSSETYTSPDSVISPTSRHTQAQSAVVEYFTRQLSHVVTMCRFSREMIKRQTASIEHPTSNSATTSRDVRVYTSTYKPHPSVCATKLLFSKGSVVLDKQIATS